MSQIYIEVPRSVKVMGDLPFFTHRCLIEPISNTPHIRYCLLKRWLTFIKNVAGSKKPLLRLLFKVCNNDCRSIAGANIHGTLQLTGKTSIYDVERSDLDHLQYFPMTEDDKWKLEIIHQLLEEREINKLDDDEEGMLEDLLTM